MVQNSVKENANICLKMIMWPLLLVNFFCCSSSGFAGPVKCHALQSGANTDLGLSVSFLWFLKNFDLSVSDTDAVTAD